MKTQSVILLLGGNQGNVIGTMAKAIALIEMSAGRLTALSSIYSTDAWGPVKQADFLNRALMLQTKLPPGMLMQRLLKIEQQCGRKRDLKYGPRTIDIDMLLYGNRVINSTLLKVPHPELHKRRFALIPSIEVAGQLKHPVLHKTMSELLLECQDKLEVRIWKL